MKSGKYGLLAPKKKIAQVVPPKRRPGLPFFNGDEEVDEDVDADKSNEDDIRRVNKQLVEKSKVVDKDLSQLYAEALDEDSSVFDYDGAYDSFAKTHQKSSTSTTKTAPKSRYVESLMAVAKVREKESDRAYERRLLKERKVEDEEFKDKAKYMTSAYKQKLIEDNKWNYEDKLTAEIEKRTDVRSRGMQGFYANLLTKNISMGGDVSSAVSAYTAGSHRQQLLSSDPTIETAEDPATVTSNGTTAVSKGGDFDSQRDATVATLSSNSGSCQPLADMISTSSDKIQVLSKRNEVDVSSDMEAIDGAAAAASSLKSEEDVPVNAVDPVARGEVILSAKERYLARKRAKVV